MDGSTLVSLRDVSRVFDTGDCRTYALHDIQLDLQAGDYLSITGPSGSGKSSLLSIIGLLDQPTTGRYLLNGVNVTSMSERQRAITRCNDIGFIFQSFNLIGDLTVYANVELPLTYRSMGATERRTRVSTAMERIGIAHRAAHFPHQLSGGEQQRVAVARAIAAKPRVLLADEPTGNLDSRHGAEVMRMISELHKSGTAVCLVTHDVRYTSDATRHIHLFDGRIEAFSVHVAGAVTAAQEHQRIGS